MSSALDMSLDEIIKNNKKSSVGRGGGGVARSRSGSGGGPLRRAPDNRASRRSAPYSTTKAPDSTWQHDKFSDQPAPAARPASLETGTKLYISNLDYGVSTEDIKELFSEIGDLKRYSIHYDRSGRSKGTAEVVFARRVDAVAAVKRYNNVQLDGKRMKIEIIEKVLPDPPAPKGGFGNLNGASRNVPGKDRIGGRPRGGGRGQRWNPGRGKGRGEKISAEALDADLDNYHSGANKTN